MADNSETVISKLANDLMALINSKPRSPTKAEIEQVLSNVPELAQTVTSTYFAIDVGDLLDVTPYAWLPSLTLTYKELK